MCSTVYIFILPNKPLDVFALFAKLLLTWWTCLEGCIPIYTLVDFCHAIYSSKVFCHAHSFSSSYTEHRQCCVDGSTMDKAVKSFLYDSSLRVCLVVFEDLLSQTVAQWFEVCLCLVLCCRFESVPAELPWQLSPPPSWIALVAQLVEHSPRLQSVVGLNPT